MIGKSGYLIIERKEILQGVNAEPLLTQAWQKYTCASLQCSHLLCKVTRRTDAAE